MRDCLETAARQLEMVNDTHRTSSGDNFRYTSSAMIITIQAESGGAKSSLLSSHDKTSAPDWLAGLEDQQSIVGALVAYVHQQHELIANQSKAL